MADRRRNIGMPSGVVFPFAGTSAPYGYLICDGRAVSRTEYSHLFAAIGTTHGTGNGTTTFNVPDYRGTFLRGKVDVSSILGSGAVSSNQAIFNNHGINRTGFKVRLSSGTLTGLAASTDYYAIVVNSNTLAFATSLSNAIAGSRVVISGINTATIVQYEDPTASSRTSNTVGSGTGNAVGGFQDHSFQAHDHYYVYRDRAGSPLNPSATLISGDVTGYKADYDLNGFRGFTETNSRIGNAADETRPKNMLVNYIIKI